MCYLVGHLNDRCCCLGCPRKPSATRLLRSPEPRSTLSQAPVSMHVASLGPIPMEGALGCCTIVRCYWVDPRRFLCLACGGMASNCISFVRVWVTSKALLPCSIRGKSYHPIPLNFFLTEQGLMSFFSHLHLGLSNHCAVCPVTANTWKELACMG